jgi:hypothetical protein
MDEFRVSRGGLDLPSIRNLISDQGLRQQFRRGYESRMKPIARHILLVRIIGIVIYARLQHASADN